MTTTTKFTASTICASSVNDIHKILDELIDDIEGRIEGNRKLKEQAKASINKELANEYHEITIQHLKMQSMLLKKKLEVEGRYKKGKSR